MSGSGTKCGGKCGGWEARCSNVATREVDGIWFCDACAEWAHRALYEGQDQAIQPDICFTPGCSKPASDYIAQQDNPALRLPICDECARHFRSVQALHDATHTSAKVLATMRATRNGHFIGLRDPKTGKVTFLGKGQITKSPALYDDAIARGEMPVWFWALQRAGVASAPDRLGYTCEIDAFPGNDRAELLGHVLAYCETEFGLKLRRKN